MKNKEKLKQDDCVAIELHIIYIEKYHPTKKKP